MTERIPEDVERDDPELADMAKRGGARIVDIKKRLDERIERDMAAGRRRSGPPKVKPITLADLKPISELELANTILPPPVWMVEPILPIGLTLFSAPPKLGKTWLNMAFARALSTGSMFCNWKPARKCRVLVLDLEGNDRRAQDRQRVIRGDYGEPSEDYLIRWAWPTMDMGGLDYLDQAITEWALDVVIIDIWGKFRGAKARNEEAYAYDYRTAGAVQELAIRRKVAIIITHHNRKAVDEDWMNQASGSSGLSGAVDNAITLRRERGSVAATMLVSGRDVEEQELALSFNGGLWTIMGDAAVHVAGEQRRSIHGVLSVHPSGMTPKAIAEETELRRDSVRRTLKKMREEGIVTSDSRDVYRLTKSA